LSPRCRGIIVDREQQDGMPKDVPELARRTLLIGSALAPFMPSLARAEASGVQNWPSHPVALIIPFPAGGAMDVLGRGVAQDLGDKLGQPFVIDNRVGAAGNIGAMAAAKAVPDGYTILMAGAASLALNKLMFGTMPYDPAGFPGFEATAWFALAAPTGTPAAIIDKINTAVNVFLRSDKGRQDLAKLDSLPAGGTPAETKAFIAAEVRKWAPIIKAANIKM
jgi:tripartite-type tricarboxylate transporter receptor subunit TctC